MFMHTTYLQAKLTINHDYIFLPTFHVFRNAVPTGLGGFDSTYLVLDKRLLFLLKPFMVFIFCLKPILLTTLDVFQKCIYAVGFCICV